MSSPIVTALATLVIGASTQVAAVAAEALTPAAFVTKASEGGLAEVEMGRVAAQKGSSAAVKDFGQKMVTDHSQAGDELAKLATSKGLMPVKSLNAEHQKTLDDLRTKNGADFDAAYAKLMVQDHDEDIALFQSASMLADADLAAYAKRMLPKLREHRQMAGHLGAH